MTVSAPSCRVCAAPAVSLLYESPRPQSLTSDSRIVPGVTRVRYCADCGHLQTDSVLSEKSFYADDYKIFSDHEEEDLLYSVANGKPLYRIEHEVATLLSRCAIPHGASVLDYGCGKGHLLRKLKERRPDLVAHTFDVSADYTPYWDRFVSREQQATFQTPADWEQRFDLVLSSFMLEHVAEPAATLDAMTRLLRTGGTLYGLVPNVFTNIADFVVVDHLSHFSEPSLRRLLQSNGLSEVVVDERAHESAFLFSGTKRPTVARPSTELCSPEALETRAREIAAVWRGYTERIQALEAGHAGARRVAIYGSGFYGTLLATTLDDISKLNCFLDRDPYRQGKQLLGVPILAPETLPVDVDLIYVGLNPRIARAAIADVPAFQRQRDKFVFP